MATLGSLVAIGAVSWSFYQSTLPTKQIVAQTTETPATIESAEPILDANTVVALTDENALSIGKNIYMSNCSACHGQSGEKSYLIFEIKILALFRRKIKHST